MALTIEQRDELLKDNFEDWLKAYTSKDKKLMYKVQLATVAFHKQKCNCTTNAVMNKLKAYYKSKGLY